MKFIAAIVFMLITTTSLFCFANQTAPNVGLEKVVTDYIDLYTKDTLEQWKNLFHPSVMVFFPADDGTITARNLDEFVERQRNYFATRKSITERLENVQILEGRRIARVVADFIFTDEGKERAGKLGLHLIEGQNGWKIVAVLFSYNKP